MCSIWAFNSVFLRQQGFYFLRPLSMISCKNGFLKRPLHAVADRSLFFQHLYVLRSLFRKTLAISLAAQIAVTPLLLSVFHSFSWHHILYNLFVPTLVGLLLWAFLVLL